ncbi:MULTISPECIES: glycosyltransferase [Pseudoalteromonas]|uniref:glycosyltransferase family 2 protein n=1 Tax=Pseudoalteromonas TaxID=53246 RepID=UPI0019D0D185|nr:MULTISPECIES: glycosyltransferase [Pseudoalteromonas]MBR8842471.1 glycosyltransferase [Pseudoalteromonas sp. JC3]QUI69729.1 glycosyltransferase [Pseudoalteromonas sp. M8]UDM62790.1 glycosyltransferase [Pseudoalteromonas piscicida]WJE09410.1 glycosyltransferase [Pseudoalteromonas sp. JC3]
MNSSLPLVTVWIPTCNRLSLLKRAVKSVQNQTYKNLELFIVDNGSTDGTVEYLQQLSAQDSRVKIHCFDTNQGACRARNYAIQHAHGVYATGLDDDDEFLPNRIAELVEAFDERYAFVCSGYIWDYGKIQRSLLDSNLIIGIDAQLNFNQASNQVLTKRERLVEAGLFDESIVSSQDWELWTRMILKYGAGKRISTPSYIVHTAHDKPRITDSLNNRMVGFQQFYERYGYLMSKSNKKCFDFLMHYSEGRKVGFVTVIKFFTPAIATKLLRAWLASLFPKLARKRLELFKRDESE